MGWVGLGWEDWHEDRRRIGVDWSRIGGGLKEGWRRIGVGWARIGEVLEEDWSRIGGWVGSVWAWDWS